jgi:hypothetical protein
VAGLADEVLWWPNRNVRYVSWRTVKDTQRVYL